MCSVYIVHYASEAQEVIEQGETTKQFSSEFASRSRHLTKPQGGELTSPNPLSPPPPPYGKRETKAGKISVPKSKLYKGLSSHGFFQCAMAI